MRESSDPGQFGCAAAGGRPLCTSDFWLAVRDFRVNFFGPQTLGGTPVSILIYVDDVDTVFPQAVSAGGQIEKPV